jgi:hypothetical protein
LMIKISIFQDNDSRQIKLVQIQTMETINIKLFIIAKINKHQIK